MHNQSIMLLVVLAAVVGGARAACDACVRGRCHARRTLARELRVPDQLAIDRARGVLYVHSDSSSDTAFFLDGLTIQLLRQQNFTGLAVDQDTHAVYTADDQNVYKYEEDKLSTPIKITFSNQEIYHKPDILFYKDCLTYTKRATKGLHPIIKNQLWYYNDIVNYTISDFVVQAGCHSLKIYFATNETVYYYDEVSRTTKAVAHQSYVLSIDKNNDVYFGDATLNVIYKMDNVSNNLVEYAAYESGSVDKFVFDNNNNIVSYDSAAGCLSLWQPDPQDDAECTIDAPHTKYRIKKFTDLDDSDCIH